MALDHLRAHAKWMHSRRLASPIKIATISACAAAATASAPCRHCSIKQPPPAPTKLTAEACLFEIERKNCHLEIAGSGFLLVEEQDPDIFLADIDLGGIGLQRTRDHSNALGVELAPQIS